MQPSPVWPLGHWAACRMQTERRARAGHVLRARSGRLRWQRAAVPARWPVVTTTASARHPMFPSSDAGNDKAELARVPDGEGAAVHAHTHSARRGGGPSFVYHMADCRYLLVDAWIAGADRARAARAWSNGPSHSHTATLAPAAPAGDRRPESRPSQLAGRHQSLALVLELMRPPTKIRACVPVTVM